MSATVRRDQASQFRPFPPTAALIPAVSPFCPSRRFLAGIHLLKQILRTMLPRKADKIDSSRQIDEKIAY